MARGGASVQIALLRGINVGGKNKLPMQELAEVFAATGCREVRTYIQSGNVVCLTEPSLAARLPSLIPEAIQERFGLRVPVVTRSAEELAAAVRDNPFLPEADPKALHLAFLADRPSAAAAAALDPARSPPDRSELRGRELYLWLPNGVGRSKLTNDYLDRTLATTSTLRNWRTVLALLDLAGRPDGRPPPSE